MQLEQQVVRLIARPPSDPELRSYRVVLVWQRDDAGRATGSHTTHARGNSAHAAFVEALEELREVRGPVQVVYWSARGD